jgi:DNA polymerase-3 subunit epsilon
MRFMNRLVGNRGRGLVAVIDLETTGLNPYRHDRIVELAALAVRLDGTVIREYVTLINPERDIGPTHIHGISSQDVLSAPRFGEIAGELVEVLDGCSTIVGHNVRFDHSFLAVEFERLGSAFPSGPTLCTMHLCGGGSLGKACKDYGINAEGQAHSASHDAYATAQLLVILLKDAPRLAGNISSRTPINWPSLPMSSVSPVTRYDRSNFSVEQPGYLQKLLTRLQPDLPPDDQDSAIFAYTALLDRVLEDHFIDEQQGQALLDLATNWRIPSDQIKKIHRGYLSRLLTTALSDGVLIDTELRDLQHVASLIGVTSSELDSLVERARDRGVELISPSSLNIEARPREEFTGKLVCFTGQSSCRLKGETISRKIAEKIAVTQGMNVSETVTKKLDILVVADPLTQSGKAKKARQYGVRIMYEPMFWQALGVKVE